MSAVRNPPGFIRGEVQEAFLDPDKLDQLVACLRELRDAEAVLLEMAEGKS